IAASVTALGKKDAALAQNNTNVENDKKQLKADTDAETVARTEFDGELYTLTALVESNAKTPAEVSGIGFKSFVRAPVQKGLPAIPDGIDVITPKKGRGKSKIAVQQPPGMRWQYVVMASPAGPNLPTATSWTLVTGNGKTRELSGASGTQLWVK